MKEEITHYLDSWIIHRLDCEVLAKGRAKINGTAWKKLRYYHLDRYLQQVEVPFGFIFNLRYKHTNVYKQIPCANKLYVVYLIKRQEEFNERKRIR